MVYMIMEFEKTTNTNLNGQVSMLIFSILMSLLLSYFISIICFFFLLTHSNFMYVYLLLFLTTWKLARGLPNIATTNVYKVGLIYLCMAYVKETARYYRYST